MNKEILEKILEILEDIKKEKKQIEKDYYNLLKTVEYLNSSVLRNSEETSHIKNLTDKFFAELNKQKEILKQLNTTVSQLDSRLRLGNTQVEPQIKTTLSSLVYDFSNFKNEVKKQLSSLENRISLLEAKYNTPTGYELKSLQNSLNEIRDVAKISTQGINAKVNNLMERIYMFDYKLKINELLLILSTSTEKTTIMSCIEKIENLISEVKTKNIAGDELIEPIFLVFENMHAYYKSIGDYELAKKFLEKKMEMGKL
ncbi:MAG: hypothetical protein N3E38_01170 [Candidatus Aenigmarchaeota archaeon]|nr:hypothetical protein [Candidatus Aenigmarchaeota archaeon]